MQNIESISPAAMKYFIVYSWPGNIRELENVIERASVLSKESTIEIDDLTPNILEEVNGIHDLGNAREEEVGDYTKRMEEFEKQLIFSALMESRGNISRAAKQLGIKRTTLRYKMQKHDLLRFKFE